MKKFLQNITLLITSVIIILLIIETYLYFDHYSPNYKRYQIKLNDVKLTFNDNPEDFFKDTNIHKTVFLGDSFTVGEVCAHDNKDFVNLIKDRKKSETTVYNFGSLGITSTDMINIYNYLEKGKINKLIIVLYYNDIFLSQQSCKNLLKFDKYGIPYVEKCNKILASSEDTSNDSNLKKIDNYLEIKLKIWRLLKEALANTPFISQFYNRSSWKYLYQDKKSDEFRLLMNTLHYFKKESETKNFDIIFTYFPDINNIIPENRLHDDWKNFIHVAKKSNIIINDPWPFFLKNASNKNLAWSLTDDHPNCEAHKIMYKFINKNLL